MTYRPRIVRYAQHSSCRGSSPCFVTFGVCAFSGIFLIGPGQTRLHSEKRHPRCNSATTPSSAPPGACARTAGAWSSQDHLREGPRLLPQAVPRARTSRTSSAPTSPSTTATSTASRPACRRRTASTPTRAARYDCGLCTEHEQHTCVALVEITSTCNLRCPMCFAESGPGGKHIDFATYTRMVDRYVELEGIADVLQLSGGEPTIHPEFVRMVRYAYEQPIEVVMINTNGIRLAHDPALVEALAADARPARDLPPVRRLGRRAPPTPPRRGAARDEAGGPGGAAPATTCAARSSAPSNTTRTCTRSAGSCGSAWSGRSSAASASSSPPTAAGTSTRGDLERRVTMPDVVKALVAQTGGLLAENDFYPLPCAHPNCHMLTYLYRGGEQPVPIVAVHRRPQAHGPDRQQHHLHAGPGPAARRAVPRRRRRLRLRPERLRRRPDCRRSTSSWSRRWPRS